MQVTFPHEEIAHARAPGGQDLPLARRTGSVQATVMRPLLTLVVYDFPLIDPPIGDHVLVFKAQENKGAFED